MLVVTLSLTTLSGRQYNYAGKYVCTEYPYQQRRFHDKHTNNQIRLQIIGFMIDNSFHPMSLSVIYSHVHNGICLIQFDLYTYQLQILLK